MNKASFVGRFVRDPELRFTETGIAVVSFTLAMRNPFRKDGSPDYIPFVAWQKTAELIAEMHRKGDFIAVDGRMESRSYENNDGEMKYVIECNVDNVTLINGRYPDEQQDDKQEYGNSKNKNQGNKNKQSNSRNTSSRRNSGARGSGRQ